MASKLRLKKLKPTRVSVKTNLRATRRTGATRRAVGLTDAPTGAQSRLANHSLIFRNFAGVFIWCSQRARFEPAGFGERSERRTGATRRAVGLTDAPTGAQSRLANHSLIFRNFAGVFIWCSQRARFEPAGFEEDDARQQINGRLFGPFYGTSLFKMLVSISRS